MWVCMKFYGYYGMSDDAILYTGIYWVVCAVIILALSYYFGDDSKGASP